MSKKSDNEIDFIIEWAVWAQLDSKPDLDLILLKGHLFSETILEVVLKRSGVQNAKDYSFFRKIEAFEKIELEDSKKKNFIASSLRYINRMRNNLAHELYFDVKDGELEIWAKNVLSNLDGKKFSKYTFRTKVVHAFSILVRNLLELTD